MNIKNIIKLSLMILMLAQILVSPDVAFAVGEIINPLCPSGDCAPGNDPRTIVGKLIASGLGIIGAVALILFMWGGLKIMLSQGNAEAVKGGKNTMLWAVIGLILIFSSYAIVNYLITNVPKG